MQVLKTLQAGDPLRSIAYDPANLYMAAATCNGSLHVWDIKAGTTVSTLAGACPVVSACDAYSKHFWGCMCAGMTACVWPLSTCRHLAQACW